MVRDGSTEDTSGACKKEVKACKHARVPGGMNADPKGHVRKAIMGSIMIPLHLDAS
jgi:hypothetical protein